MLPISHLSKNDAGIRNETRPYVVRNPAGVRRNENGAPLWRPVCLFSYVRCFYQLPPERAGFIFEKQSLQ
jgi:hypothetical protein